MPKGGARPGAGRPIGSKSRTTSEMRASARLFTDEAMQILANIARKSKKDVNKIAAVKELMDRAHGKAAQPITGEDGGPIATKMVVSWQNSPHSTNGSQQKEIPPNGSPSQFQKAELTKDPSKKKPSSTS